MKTLLWSALALGLAAGPALAQTIDEYDNPIPEERTFLRDRDRFEGLTAGPGREETYYAFKGCFKIGWIKRQKLTRTEWDLAVDQMARDCNLDPFAPEEKEVIVEYLATYYGRRR
jgi:hypothetical protein